jgi:hypothetical protein
MEYESSNAYRVDSYASYLITHKWRIRWACYFTWLVMYLVAIYLLRDSFFIQTGILLLTVIAMILIMLQNNEENQARTKDQINNFHASTTRHIHALRESADSQIKTIQETSLECQRVAQEAANAQICALKDSTDKQIQTFVDQSQDIVTGLEKVAGILETDEELKRIEEEHRKAEEERRIAAEKQMQNEIIKALGKQPVGARRELKPMIQISIPDPSGRLFKDYTFTVKNVGTDVARNLRIFYNEQLKESIPNLGVGDPQWFKVASWKLGRIPSMKVTAKYQDGTGKELSSEAVRMF